MSALLALAPFALVPALLATGRVGALASGLAGLLAALAAAALLQPGPPSTVAAILARDVAEGGWLALQAALFIVSGLFFHLAVQAAREEVQPASLLLAPSGVASTAAGCSPPASCLGRSWKAPPASAWARSWRCRPS